MKADERIKNIKIYVDGRSAEIQKKLFELGAEWAFYYGKEIQYTDKPFIFVSDSFELCQWYSPVKRLEWRTNPIYLERVLNTAIRVLKEHGFIGKSEE